MYVSPFFILLFAVSILILKSSCDSPKPRIDSLRIGIKKKVDPADCKIRAGTGDELHMHYVGTLHQDGTQFDSSLERNSPFVFTLGTGQVIKGWDKGLIGACIGEKRKLIIPAVDGYGEGGSPPKIPPDSDLVFDVEVLDIKPKKSDL